MNLEYINGDITQVPPKHVIVHGVNCKGVMGSGVALALKTKWPIIYDHFKRWPASPTNLGNIDVVYVNNDIFVVNAFTQVTYGASGVHAKLPAIKSALELVSFYVKAGIFGDDKYTIAMPKIGAGLGGLNWDKDVFPVISSICIANPDINYKVYYI